MASEAESSKVLLGMQETLYWSEAADYSPMQSRPELAARIAAEAFRKKLVWLREEYRGISQEALAEAVKARGGKLSQKSVSNLENPEFNHNSTLAKFAQAADEFGVPPWVMFHPGIDFALLQGKPLQRLVKLIDDYLACQDDQREFVEKMAAGYAGLNPKREHK